MMTAVILAAGRSSRFGRPKAFLPVGPGGPPFVERLVATFRSAGVNEVVVVGRAGDDGLRECCDRAGARFVENPRADRGQLSSLICALDALGREVSAVIVTPVDMPLIRADTIGAVRDAFLGSGAAIARAAYRGRHGHPVIFAAAVFGELRRADPDHGAKAVVRAHGTAVLDVDVDDEGVLRDVDTAQDYRDLFGADA